MNNAQKYFNRQMENQEFQDSLNAVSEQIDIEWELERVKLRLKIIQIKYNLK